MKERFKFVRESLKMSQREFGLRLGVGRDVIANIEYGRVEPKPLMIEHLCETYGVNENWLKTGEGDPFLRDPATNQKTDEAMRLFRTLRPEFQDYALEQIRKLLELQEK